MKGRNKMDGSFNTKLAELDALSERADTVRLVMRGTMGGEA